MLVLRIIRAHIGLVFLQYLDSVNSKQVTTAFRSTTFFDITKNVGESKQLQANVVYPGTKWCGNGNVAEDYNDLGYYAETDSCCRDHDHCEDVIPAITEKHNLTNDAVYTRLMKKGDT